MKNQESTWFSRVMKVNEEIEMAARTFNVCRLRLASDALRELVAEEQER